jgi:aspartyl protease family protein
MVKFAPFVLATIIVGASVGWFAPDASEQIRTLGAPTTGDAALTVPENRLDVAQQDTMSGGEVVLPRAVDGHFYADVTIDGSTAHMLVDTGASMIALTDEDAAAIGVHWDETAVQPVARGASGLVYGVPVTLATVGIGELEAQKVEAVVVPDGLDISLLGQSFLSRIGKVEMDQQRMLLGG